jgi:mannose-6-phosphate isomerase-like protein (cupin superfamily)
MSIPVFSKDRILAPIDTPHGEIIYELVGRSAEHGGAQAHSLAHVVLPPGKASLAHFHHVSEESYYILKGQARMVIDGQECLLSPGDACLLSPRQVHQIFNDGETDLEFLAVCVPAWQPGDSFYEK